MTRAGVRNVAVCVLLVTAVLSIAFAGPLWTGGHPILSTLCALYFFASLIWTLTWGK